MKRKTTKIEKEVLKRMGFSIQEEVKIVNTKNPTNKNKENGTE